MTSKASPTARTLTDVFAAMAETWPDSDIARSEGRYIQRVLDGVGGLETDEVPFVSTTVSALAFALVDHKDRICLRDTAFAVLNVAESGAATVAKLAKRARQDDVALGLIETGLGDVIAICAALPAQASAWPLSAALRSALEQAAEPVVLAAFAPARASDLALEAVAVFGLSELQARVSVALLEAPTLQIAADQVGVGRETARDALAGAMRKMGVGSTPLLVRRLTDLIHGGTLLEENDLLAEALHLTDGEARVARLAAEGATTARAAAALGVKPETVKTHLRSAFSKAGVSRAKDLGRLDLDLRFLSALARAREVAPRADSGDGRLRIVVRRDGRRVAFMDYGVVHGPLLVVCHALASGRTLPSRFAEKLKIAGFRTVIPQRPGFGLTDAAQGDYLTTSAEDMAAILDALKRDSADIFGRDIATATLMAFAERFPERLDRVLLLNPERQVRSAAGRRYALPAAARLLQHHPEMTAAFFELLRRQTRTDRLTALLKETFKNGAPSDAEGLRQPANLAWMVRDIQAMVARSISGVVQERLVYAGGWTPPRHVGGRHWTIARCAELRPSPPEDWWNNLPGFRLATLDVGGLHAPLTHPEAVVRLLRKGDA